MQIGIPRESRPGETRVAATPETVKKLAASGKHAIVVESDAGSASAIADAQYAAAGATIGSASEAFGADVVLKVRSPVSAEIAQLKRGAMLVGLMNPFDAEGLGEIARSGVTAFALEWLPRTTRAQSMDVLSSQANIAGYKAVLLAAVEFGKFLPMLMTAAGTVKAARVLIMGVGVAGLQAIATAKRLGAVIEASDVRPSVRDQVESLGGKWVDVPYETAEEKEIAEGVGGYARPMPATWMERQAAIVAERAKAADIVITTALIPGRAAPRLIKAETVAAMKPGSIIVDLAAEQGGNVEGSEAGRTVIVNGVKLIGPSNLPATVATDASALYARNVVNFLALSLDYKTGEFAIARDDDIVKATLVCDAGAIVPRA